MESTCNEDMPSPTLRTAETTVYAVLFAISFSHLLNDTIQALLVSIYPLLKESYHLTFSQLGMITFAFQVTASLLQPLVAGTPTSAACRSHCPSAWG